MMWHGGWSGADWALMGVTMLVFWTLVVVAVVWVVRTLGDAHRSPAPVAPARPRDILDERYARGELTDDEYRTRRDALSDR